MASDVQPKDVSSILPAAYRDAGFQIYFQDALHLLQQHSWVYDFKLTKFISQKVWQKIPQQWKDHLVKLTNEELNNVPYGYMKDEWPESLKCLLTTSLSLSLERTRSPGLVPVDVNPRLRRGMNPKKHHEVSLLSGVVQRVCRQQHCQAVVDVGSGLGYLGQVLSQQCGVSVLGLEGKAAYAHSASTRNKVQSGTEAASASFQTVTCELQDCEESFQGFRDTVRDWMERMDTCQWSHSVQDTSSEEVKQGSCQASRYRTQDSAASTNSSASDSTVPNFKAIDTTARNSHADNTRQRTTDNNTCCSSHSSDASGCHQSSQRSVCMVGLHCCGDLTPTMLRLFTSTPSLTAMVCVSCCYHGN